MDSEPLAANGRGVGKKLLSVFGAASTVPTNPLSVLCIKCRAGEYDANIEACKDDVHERRLVVMREELYGLVYGASRGGQTTISDPAATQTRLDRYGTAMGRVIARHGAFSMLRREQPGRSKRTQ